VPSVIIIYICFIEKTFACFSDEFRDRAMRAASTVAKGLTFRDAKIIARKNKWRGYENRFLVATLAKVFFALSMKASKGI